MVVYLCAVYCQNWLTNGQRCAQEMHMYVFLIILQTWKWKKKPLVDVFFVNVDFFFF